jgi:hypoxanthine phosphoribosyltransferase
MVTANHHGFDILLSRDQIAQRVQEIGASISRDFQQQEILLVGVLKGAAFFLADLARSISVDASFDFIAVSSYGAGATRQGPVRLIKDVDTPLAGKNVILVEDILDTGLTIHYLRKMLAQHNPNTLKIATLLDKPERRLEKIEADYVGFTIPNRFVVGYGMDFGEKYRNLSDICILPS